MPAPTQPEEAASNPSLDRAHRLLAPRKKADEILIRQEGTANRGPYTFKPGIYRVRFQQFAEQEIDFSHEASSLVVQLDRQPGEVGAETVTAFNATRESGSNQITVPGGRLYIDISSEDYGVALRFTPEG